VIPVGAAHGEQDLLLVEMGEDGEVRERSVLPVRFVPLTGER
jgi:protein-L-isoaspartate(D-aspartate) O-methyltransferase